MKKPMIMIGAIILVTPIGGMAQTRKKVKLPDVNAILPLLNARSPQALSGVLRGAVLKVLPTPLYEKSENWGNQRRVRHIHWERRGIIFRPRSQHRMRNHGTWRNYRMTGDKLANTLILDIRNVRFPEKTRMTFQVYIAFDARAEATQQNWNRGLRLWSGTVRARFRAKLLLNCEASTRLERNKKRFLPDAVFQMRATKANVSYDNLVYEHLPGIGGAAARVLGKTFHRALKQWHPSLERRLLNKANTAIVRAAKTREVRVSLSRVFNRMLRK